jgi:Asp-tRNA(Asn)/Glu-tRNA(Gln) amidotransferase A subunit family amidase
MSTKQSWKSFFSDRKTYEKIVREREKTVGSFLHFRVGKGKDADSPVAGLPFGIKDNIALDNYPSPVVPRCCKASSPPTQPQRFRSS